jgi:hypothetical protein
MTTIDSDLPLEGTCISPVTFLTTDYLNHFNEPVMMLQMASDVPDVVNDLRVWKPKDYVAHYQSSGIADRELAIVAYGRAPDAYRVPFDDTIGQLVHEIYLAVEIAGVSPLDNRALDGAVVRCLDLISRAQSIANGIGLEQNDIDSMFD